MRVCIKNSPNDLNKLIVTDENGKLLEGVTSLSIDADPFGSFVSIQIAAQYCQMDLNLEVNELNNRKIEEISPGLTMETNGLKLYNSEFNY